MIFLVLLILFIPVHGWGAITFDAASVSGGTTSTSHSHTVAADANLAVICVSQRDTGQAVVQAASVTIGGEAASLLDRQNNNINAIGVDFWYKLSPPTGSQTVAVSGGAVTDRMVTSVMTFKGAAQTSTFNTVSKIGSTINGTNADLDGIASAVGELVALCGSSRVLAAAPSPDATSPVSTERNELGFDSGGTSTTGFSYTEDGDTPTIDMRIDLASSDSWALVGASIRPLAVDTRRPQMPLMMP